MYEDLCVIVPTLNERGNIKKFVLLSRIFCPNSKIIFADDGSEDGTREIVQNYKDKNIVLLDRKYKKIHGLTASVLDAIDFCDRPYFVVIDVDMQHPIDKIKDIYNELKRGADVVVGNRVKIKENWPFSRRLISKTAILLGSIRLRFAGVKVKDPISGFFGMSTELAREIMSYRYLKFELEGYKVLFDFLKYMLKGVKISNIDYVFNVRERGQSKLRPKVMFSYFRSLLK